MNDSNKKPNINRIIRLLKLLLTIDDKDVIKATLESIIDTLEENQK